MTSPGAYGVTWHVYRGPPCDPGRSPRYCPGCHPELPAADLDPDWVNRTGPYADVPEPGSIHRREDCWLPMTGHDRTCPQPRKDDDQ